MCKTSREMELGTGELWTVGIHRSEQNQGSTGQGDEFQSGTVLRHPCWRTFCLNLDRGAYIVVIRPWILAQSDAAQAARGWNQGDPIRSLKAR